MFRSYKHKYLGERDGNGTWEYELTDSEFGIVSGTVVSEYWVGLMAGTVIAVIREYRKRNLNVAANLAVCFVWFNKQHPFWSIQQLIDDNKKYNPPFPQYEEDLQKYLTLI
jgi:hypothetical protein